MLRAVQSVTARLFAAVPTEAVAGFCAAAALVSALLRLAFEGSVVPDARQALAALPVGLGPVGAAFFPWDAGMKRGDPRLFGLLADAEPVAATLLLAGAGPCRIGTSCSPRCGARAAGCWPPGPE